jgi:hypothetical protein
MADASSGTETPKPVLNLTAEQAEILLKADLRNLAKKVQQGRTLSPSERNLLQSVLGGGKPSKASFARNQVELAELLGVSRKTIQRARKKPGNPGAQPDGRYDVTAWREFIRSNGRALDDDEDVGASGSPAQLKARHILLQNQKLEFQLAILRKEYIPAADVEKWGGELGTTVRKVVSQIHLCAPSVVGLSVPEAEARLKEIEDEILEQLHLLDQHLAEVERAA